MYRHSWILMATLRFIGCPVLMVATAIAAAADLDQYRKDAEAEENRLNQIVAFVRSAADLHHLLAMGGVELHGCLIASDETHALNEVARCIIAHDRLIERIRLSERNLPQIDLPPSSPGEAELHAQRRETIAASQRALKQLNESRSALLRITDPFLPDHKVLCKPAPSYVASLESLRPRIEQAIKVGDLYELRGTLTTVEGYAAMVRVGRAICAQSYASFLAEAEDRIGDLRKLARSDSVQALFERACESIKGHSLWASICLTPPNQSSEYALHRELKQKSAKGATP